MKLEFPEGAGVRVVSQQVKDGKLLLELAVDRSAAERTVTAEDSPGATLAPRRPRIA